MPGCPLLFFPQISKEVVDTVSECDSIDRQVRLRRDLLRLPVQLRLRGPDLRVDPQAADGVGPEEERAHEDRMLRAVWVSRQHLLRQQHQRSLRGGVPHTQGASNQGQLHGPGPTRPLRLLAVRIGQVAPRLSGVTKALALLALRLVHSHGRRARIHVKIHPERGNDSALRAHCTAMKAVLSDTPGDGATVRGPAFAADPRAHGHALSAQAVFQTLLMHR
mmetsp:Transcript_56701/g.151251  ORF Transcript_56701/g.151251 Transcript_56701/m.151251 type:complete len:220 (-) Transcript_56701:141-800(-)